MLLFISWYYLSQMKAVGWISCFLIIWYDVTVVHSWNSPCIFLLAHARDHEYWLKKLGLEESKREILELCNIEMLNMYQTLFKKHQDFPSSRRKDFESMELLH